KLSENSWTPLPVPGAGIIDQAEFGPLFVNPYDPSIMYVVCVDGIYQYDAVQKTFSLEKQLTSLITSGGKYPVNDVFFGGNTGLNNAMGSRANPMCPLSCMAFNQQNPKQI